MDGGELDLVVCGVLTNGRKVRNLRHVLDAQQPKQMSLDGSFESRTTATMRFMTRCSCQSLFLAKCRQPQGEAPQSK